MADTNDDGGQAFPTDTEMLDWLDAQRTGYGAGIIFRLSSLGRGWRLHETSRPHAGPGLWRVPQSSVRAAIADAMIAEKRRRESTK